MSDLTGWIAQLPDYIAGLLVSLQLTGWVLVIGLPIGIILALALLAPSRWIRRGAIVFTEIGRGLPGLVLLYLVYYGGPSLGVDLPAFWATVLALAISAGAYTAEVFRAAIAAVPTGQREAAAALGMSDARAFLLVILPQALRPLVPPLLNTTVIVFQGTSLAYAISVQELTSQAYQIAALNYDYLVAFAIAGAFYAVLIIPVSLWVERRMLLTHA